jgi:hypothetical protein
VTEIIGSALKTQCFVFKHACELQLLRNEIHIHIQNNCIECKHLKVKDKVALLLN